MKRRFVQSYFFLFRRQEWVQCEKVRYRTVFRYHEPMKIDSDITLSNISHPSAKNGEDCHRELKQKTFQMSGFVQ